MKNIRKPLYILMTLVVMALMTALPASAVSWNAKPIAGPVPVPTYMFARWHDTNGNGLMDYWGGDICLGNEQRLMVSKVVPAGQLAPFFYAYITHSTYVIDTWQKMVDCKRQSTVAYTGPQAGETWRVQTPGFTTTFTVPNPWYGGIQIILHKE